MRNRFLWAGVSLMVVRVIIALRAPFGIYHGFNEAFYGEVAKEYGRGVPMWLGQPFYDTPPLLTAWILASAKLFGWHVWTLRIPSILCYGLLGVASWVIGQRLRGDGAFRVFLVASTPWVAYWMTKAQTDPLLTVFLALVVVLYLDGSRPAATWVGLFVFLGLMSKQTMILVSPVVVLWPQPFRARAIASSCVGGLFAGLWWLWQFTTHPEAVTASLRFHATARAVPFGDWIEVVGLGILFGGSMLILTINMEALDSRLRPILYSCALFLAFAVIEAPINHAYYALPGVFLLTVLAPHRTHWKPILRGLIPTIGVAGVCILLVVGGELGPNVLGEALNRVPHGTPVQSQIWPQAYWLGEAPPPMINGCPRSNLSLCNAPQPGCTTIQTFGWLWRDLWLVSCGSAPGTSPPSSSP